ncbi:MAG: PrsW family intramembrane metalloprotease [Prolixibacteraceae bacterium]|jgi:protease PrsW|nr:PrsW family intramembrane metalloprotease [Prolixibacteraceae bacterium]MBT6006638.1 PrsW family intramembrane metalloprotease [Prolixibacteraceae bacterium]MBT6766603.1 PrsW family intramembrane metalloprotease [Prolixibacteraceae bacterium]MBT7000335.1 PrsW family intramembrane metalloprotease [Prolixibacteraceae bacterium]MBT7395419.1 PrsW family intramembrane metalloprotease [Prolixibacteraceae bacterium]
MNLFILSLAPVIIIAGYVYFRDKYEREPIRLLIFALLAGALTVIPILFLEQFLDKFTELFPGLSAAAWKAFVVAGFSEELFKYIALYLLIWKSREFNEKFDGIVYAVFVSLGFAAVENVMYVMGNGLSTGIMRAITAVPAHAVFGITMGFYFGLAKFYEKERNQLKIKALLYPILLHGIYDFILFTGIEWLTIVFFAFVVFLYISGLKRIKKLSDQSIYKTDFDLLNKKFEQDQNR